MTSVALWSSVTNKVSSGPKLIDPGTDEARSIAQKTQAYLSRLVTSGYEARQAVEDAASIARAIKDERAGRVQEWPSFASYIAATDSDD